ncbi:MAG TPA: DUF3093 domain-containing protein [Candidatus Nanopelagicaceae bacterium]
MSNSANNYKERTPWPIWLWLFLLFLTASLALAIWAALGTRWGAIAMLLQVLGLLYLSQSTLLVVEVTGNQLTVGKAHIDRQYLGAIEVLSPDQMRQWRGPLSDPAGFMALRFWIPRGVKIEIKDPKDSTPYWLVSSKKAQRLADALLTNF